MNKFEFADHGSADVRAETAREKAERVIRCLLYTSDAADE